MPGPDRAQGKQGETEMQEERKPGGYTADASAAPTLEDLKRMVLQEAGGQAFYQALAETTDNADIKRLLGRTANEELSHAHRVQEVIQRLHGQAMAIPDHADNPYAKVPADLAVTRPLLEMIVAEELKGEVLYEGWAAHVDDAEAASLLRRNGTEERRHAERAQDILKLAGL
ncbi:ferritin family protein [Zavarzinia sp. CC-PAN008]|uniref:ferritin family protein n=1 Tax=Zavarzinia sp. CC-PAN008 TaxID=3243332 RepID=UPI003F746A77